MPTADVKPSNRKPPAKSEAPNEPFKRALASCTRALAHRADLEVAFAPDKPSLVSGPEGARARLPEPPRKPNPREAAILRGLADSMALRLACHNDAIHRRHAPHNPAARALFDAAEQARVEAIGARRMEGVAANLTAMLDDRYPSQPARRGARPRRGAAGRSGGDAGARAPDRACKPPSGAARLVELWRPIVEAKGGAELDKLGGAINDQRAFARSLHRLLASLDLPSDSEADADETEENSDDDAPPESAEDAEGEGEQEDSADSMEKESSEDTSDELEEGALEADEAPSSELPEDVGGGRIRGSRREPAAAARAASGAGPITRPIRRASTRRSTPRISATPMSCSGCATISTSSCRTCRASSAVSPIGCNAG